MLEWIFHINIFRNKLYFTPFLFQTQWLDSLASLLPVKPSAMFDRLTQARVLRHATSEGGGSLRGHYVHCALAIL